VETRTAKKRFQNTTAPDKDALLSKEENSLKISAQFARNPAAKSAAGPLRRSGYLTPHFSAIVVSHFCTIVSTHPSVHRSTLVDVSFIEPQGHIFMPESPISIRNQWFPSPFIFPHTSHLNVSTRIHSPRRTQISGTSAQCSRLSPNGSNVTILRLAVWKPLCNTRRMALLGTLKDLKDLKDTKIDKLATS
jgi:hypothetical protein